MANKKLGYIKLYRSIQDHWLWSNNESFTAGQAWIDLLLMVNHKEEKIRIKGQIITVHPGQRWTSYRKLAAKWHWSVNKVKRYMKLLKSDEMILTDETNNGTLVTIVNWDKFAIQKNTDEYTDEHTDGYTSVYTDEHTDGYQTRMIKNDKNDKELKEIRTPAPPNDGGEWQ